MTVKFTVLQEEDYVRGLNRRLRRSADELSRAQTVLHELLVGLGQPPRVGRKRGPKKVRGEVIARHVNPAHKEESRQVKMTGIATTTNFKVDPTRKAVAPAEPPELKTRPAAEEDEAPVPNYPELFKLPKVLRRLVLAAFHDVEPAKLHEALLAKRPVVRRDPDTPDPFRAVYYGWDSAAGGLVGPKDSPKEFRGTSYEVLVDRHSAVKDGYLGKLPYPILDLGYEEWSLLHLPLANSATSPVLFRGGRPVPSDDADAEAKIRSFAKAISLRHGLAGSLELPIRVGSKCSLVVVGGDPRPLDPQAPVEKQPFGRRFKERLGVTFHDGDSTEKRAKFATRSYDAAGSIPQDKVRIVLIDKLRLWAKPITDAMIEALPTVHARTIMKVKQVLYRQGYRPDDSATRRKRMMVALDGVIFASATLRSHSVKRMKARQAELGIDPALIHKCAAARQMSFRGLIPGSGQLKGMAQVVDWLPYGYVLTHSCNVKREVSVDRALADGTPVPFRYYWDAYGGKKQSRLNLQYMTAHPGLFPFPAVRGWFNQMKAEHSAKVEADGVVDDRAELIDLFLGGDRDDERENGFNAGVRLNATELTALGFDVREFPQICAAAAKAATRNWVKRDTMQLRVAVPGAVHYQLISQTAMLLVDPEAPTMFNPDKGVRFHARQRVAYQDDALYEKSMVDHGGADGDDHYDFILRRWSKAGDSKVVVFRLRCPSRPSEWGMDELEGHPPVDVKEADVEEVPESTKKWVRREWGRRAHLLPPVVNPPLPTAGAVPPAPVDGLPRLGDRKAEPGVAPPYGWARYLRNVEMVGAHPGLLVNLIGLSWCDRDFYLNNVPCGMEFVVDACTKDAAKYGTEGLALLQAHVVAWFTGWITSKIEKAGGDLAATGIDWSLVLRKGGIGVLRMAEMKEWADEGERLAGLDPRPACYHFTNLVEELHRDLADYQDLLTRHCVERALALPTRPFGDNVTVPVKGEHAGFVVTYSKYAAGHWLDSSFGRRLVETLKEAVGLCGLDRGGEPYTDPNLFDLYTFKPSEWVSGARLRGILNHNGGRYPAKGFNYRWKNARIRDGLDTAGGRVPAAQKVYRKGLSLLAAVELEKRPGEAGGEFLAGCLRYCLSTYSLDSSKPVRVEDFLSDSEETWSRFIVWLLLEWERKPLLLGYKQEEEVVKVVARKYTFTFDGESLELDLEPKAGLRAECAKALDWLKRGYFQEVKVSNGSKTLTVEEVLAMYRKS